MPVAVALAIGRGAVGGRTPFSQFPMCKSLPPESKLPPSIYDPDFPICEANISKGVCPTANAKPTSLIIGAIISARCLFSGDKSIALFRDVAQPTTPSCQVDLKPFPPNFPPSGVLIPLLNKSFRCSSIALVLVIHLCHCKCVSKSTLEA